MKDIVIQMRALDDFVTCARSQNAQHHDSHVVSLDNLSGTVKKSYSSIGTHFTSTYERVRDLGEEMSAKTASLQDALAPLDENLREPLANLRLNITSTTLQEYQPTRESPQKVQYEYSTHVPRPEPHENLLAALRRPMSTQSSHSSSKSTTTIPVIFNGGPSSDPPRDFPRSLAFASPDIEKRPMTSGGCPEN